MGRTVIGCGMLLLALGIAAHPAHARDRKAPLPRERESLGDGVGVRETRQVSFRHDASGASLAKAVSARAVVDSSAAKPNGKPTAPLAEQQPGRAEPLSFKLGAVTLRPAVGGIKGAQFSIGF